MFERLLLAFLALFAKPTVGDPCDDLVGEGSYGDERLLINSGGDVLPFPSPKTAAPLRNGGLSLPAGELRPASLCAPAGVPLAGRGFDIRHSEDCECQECWNLINHGGENGRAH